MSVHIESRRLVLRDFASSDLDGLFDLYRRDETSEFESWSPHKSIDDTRGLLAYWIDAQEQNPRTDYALAITLYGKFVGLCGIELGFGTETDDLRCGFLGYRLTPPLWGQGIATEAAGALLRFGFDVLGLHRIHTGCSESNAASIRVIEKAGFTLEGTTRKSFPIGNTWTNYHVYGMLADECPSQGR